jgi:hypothetical protein
MLLTPRSSFTLVEMVLVLALIVLVASITVPALDAMYADYKVMAAADQVRARWADARTQAVNEGRSYRFAVVRNQGNFRVAPDSPEFWSNGSSGSEPTTGGLLIVEDTLPRGIRFAVGDLNSEDFTNDTALPAEAVSPDQWTSIVTFLPDGRATALDGTDSNEVRIIFQARNARPVQLRLRTLTGTVTARPLDEDIRP